MLSIITTGRNDDYEHDFLDRLYKSLAINNTILSEKLPYEYILVEWSPYKELICNLDRFKPLFEQFTSLRSVVVDNSVASNEGLNPSRFYEYFAKNVGLRQAKYDKILILNSDIVVTHKLVDEIITKINHIDNNKFYRARYRQKMGPKWENVGLQDLHMPTLPDACICGAYSGDFLLCTREAFYEKGRGYNETDPAHRTKSQTGMDGEILWNMYNRGMTLEFIESPYYHLEHSKTADYDGTYREKIQYDNKPDWGFINYKQKQNENHLLIYKD